MKIINKASQAGQGGGPLAAVCCTIKAALISWAQSAELGLIRHGINVNSIAPSIVDCEYWDNVYPFFCKI